MKMPSRGVLDVESETKKPQEESNKSSTWRHGESVANRRGGRAGAAGKKIKVHSNPEVIYGVLDFRARVRPALMNTIDSILLETARKGRGGRERERSGKGESRVKSENFTGRRESTRVSVRFDEESTQEKANVREEDVEGEAGGEKGETANALSGAPM